MSMTYRGWIYVVFCTMLLQGLMCEAAINVTQCSSFEENVANTVEALINNTAINEETRCIGSIKDAIEIVFRNASVIPTYQCIYNFGTCTISSASDPSKCGCTSGTGDIFTYTLEFTATKTNNEGGEIIFRSNCQRPLGVFLIKASCTIAFATTTAPPATTDNTTSSTSSTSTMPSLATNITDSPAGPVTTTAFQPPSTSGESGFARKPSNDTSAGDKSAANDNSKDVVTIIVIVVCVGVAIVLGIILVCVQVRRHRNDDNNQVNDKNSTEQNGAIQTEM